MSDEIDMTRLYGFEGSEVMYFHPHKLLDGAYYFDEDANRLPVVIEEWSAIPLGSKLPSADDLIRDIIERVCEDEYEDAGEHLDDGLDEDIVAMFQAALDAWAEGVVGACADRKLRDIQVTWADDDSALYDGAPWATKS